MLKVFGHLPDLGIISTLPDSALMLSIKLESEVSRGQLVLRINCDQLIITKNCTPIIESLGVLLKLTKGFESLLTLEIALGALSCGPGIRLTGAPYNLDMQFRDHLEFPPISSLFSGTTSQRVIRVCGLNHRTLAARVSDSFVESSHKVSFGLSGPGRSFSKVLLILGEHLGKSRKALRIGLSIECLAIQIEDIVDVDSNILSFDRSLAYDDPDHFSARDRLILSPEYQFDVRDSRLDRKAANLGHNVRKDRGSIALLVLGVDGYSIPFPVDEQT